MACFPKQRFSFIQVIQLAQLDKVPRPYPCDLHQGALDFADVSCKIRFDA